jgi:vacuolar-type H+-ATPase subunit H
VSGETAKQESGWTIDTLSEHWKALRDADIRFDAERDRRNTEVSQEREKALKIKEEADKAALGLAREIQTYKDEKANELRSQIERERGTYVTQSDLKGAVEKIDATMAPVVSYVASQQGGSKGMRDMYGWIFGAVMLLIAVVGLYLKTN